MKSNPALMKAQYESQMGRTLSDAEFNSIVSMTTPEMMRMSANMMKSNPDMMKQAQQAKEMHAQRAANPQQNPYNFTPPAPTPTPQPKEEVKAKPASTGTGTEDDPII